MRIWHLYRDRCSYLIPHLCPVSIDGDYHEELDDGYDYRDCELSADRFFLTSPLDSNAKNVRLIGRCRLHQSEIHDGEIQDWYEISKEELEVLRILNR